MKGVLITAETALHFTSHAPRFRGGWIWPLFTMMPAGVVFLARL